MIWDKNEPDAEVHYSREAYDDGSGQCLRVSRARALRSVAIGIRSSRLAEPTVSVEFALSLDDAREFAAAIMEATYAEELEAAAGGTST